MPVYVHFRDTRGNRWKHLYCSRESALEHASRACIALCQGNAGEAVTFTLQSDGKDALEPPKPCYLPLGVSFFVGASTRDLAAFHGLPIWRVAAICYTYKEPFR